MKNAAIPLVTILLPLITGMLTGSIFIESIFSVPGIGRFFTTSALVRDYPMIMALAMLVAVLWGLMYLVSDVLYALIDPRVGLAGEDSERRMTEPTATPAARAVEAGQPVPIEIAPGTVAEAARRFFANRLAVVGLIVAILIIAVAVLADVLSPYPRDFADFSEVLQYPSPEHPLGTDAVGRDFLSRVLHGARTSVIVGLSVPLLSALIGIPLGAWAGWHGGRFDFVFLRAVEVTTAIPGYMLAILLVTIWGGGLELLIFYSRDRAGGCSSRASPAPSSSR